MESALFRLLCVTAAAVSFFIIIPANYLQQLPPVINLCVAVFGVASLALFREAHQRRYHFRTLFFLLLALLNLVWFPNGASHGSVPLYFFCAFMYLPIFMRGRARWFLLALTIADGVLLMLLELRFPEWVVPFRSSYDRVSDLAVGLTVAALCCALMLWSLLRRYETERRRLVALNEDLQRTILERAAAESALQQNRELLDSIVSGTTDAIFVKDISGRYLLFNSAAARMTGKSPEQVLGKDDTELFAPQVAEEIMEMDRSVMASNESLTAEHELTTGTGQRRTVEVMKGPLHDKRGNVIGVFGISRDVTHSRRMEEELRLLNEELERRVATRTARLETAMREQETFSYSVSHDLRGPLRHINGYTSILVEEFGAGLAPEARQYLDRIRTSSRRMGDLIDDLLELSRIGRLELNKAPVSLSEIVFAIGCKLQDAEPMRRVDLIIEPGLQAKGDRVLLEQMLENLVGNAWKYSSVRERAQIELGRCVLKEGEAFFVRDNGVGFDMTYQDKLFGAFQRLHGAEFEGTGIGLATVKRIVERHGGSVWAHGVVDQGATVYFTLP